MDRSIVNLSIITLVKSIVAVESGVANCERSNDPTLQPDNSSSVSLLSRRPVAGPITRRATVISTVHPLPIDTL